MLNPLKWFRSEPAEAKASEPTLSGLDGRLRGYFSVTGKTITGWVSTEFIRPEGAMEVEFRRGKEVLARTTAHPKSNGDMWRFVFTTETGPWYKEEELLDDTLVVHVDNGKGATGILTLDGETQIELIRGYMNDPDDVELDLSFARGGNARAHMGEGWAKSDPNWTWTDGRDSVLTFPTPARPGTYAFRFAAGAFVLQPDVPRQDSEVYFGDEYLTNVVQTVGNFRYHDVRIPANLLVGTQSFSLRFHHLFAARPSDFGRPITRLQAFRFRQATLIRMRGAKDDL